MASVCVDIELSEISTEELIHELRLRMKREEIKTFDIQLEDVIEFLELLNCPADILKPLQDWGYSKTLTKSDLDRWVVWVGA